MILMTFDEFLNKYDGKGIDYDGAYGNQCVDLYRQYVKEVLGFPQSPSVEGAKDIWNTYLPEYYQRIENTPYGVPSKGDIVIFGTTIGKWGHVSVFLEGNLSRFTSFDQNYPTGTPCHKQGHTYNAVLGWLRPIIKNMELPEWFKTLLQEANLSLEREGDFRAFWDKAKRFDDEVNTLKKQVVSANEALADRAREVSMLTEKNQRLEDRAIEAEEKLNQARSERDTLDWKLTQAELQIKTFKEEIEELQNKIQAHEENNHLMAYSWGERFVSLFKRR